VLKQLAARGVRIGIDDFGTGHSSLPHLNVLPVHTLKIDRSLIEGLGQRQEAAAVVSAIVGLGHSLDFTVTAEGIEDDMQLHMLRTLGCDLGQGYYFARPQPGLVVRALVHHRFRWIERVSA
jgi:EAL domain-containing protein (putative c-di-GMP-specific phosphodiesterase class I)